MVARQPVLRHHRVKNAASTDLIRKTDLDQLSGSLSWFRGEYAMPATAVAVIIHLSNKIHPAGAALPTAVLSPPRRCPRSPETVRRWTTAPAGDDQYRNPDLMRQQFAARKLQGRNAVEAYAPRGRLVLAPALPGNWPVTAGEMGKLLS